MKAFIGRLVIVCWAVVFSAGGAELKGDLLRLRGEQMARLRAFAAQKEVQAKALAGKANEKFLPPFEELFAAAKKGDAQTVTNIYEDIKRRHQQYNDKGDIPHTSYWSTVLEISLAYFEVAWGEADHVQLAVDGFMKSVPEKAIYFGGTDPGRGLPTAFSKDHVKADPFFTITQNALADGSYLEYLRGMYGDRIYIASVDDSTAAFQAYIEDAGKRLKSGKLKPGEDVKITDGRISVSGQVAVMAINAQLAKVIFDKNPDREFYIEESFPLDWMFPHLTPAGQVMKLERKPLDRISEAAIEADTKYWNRHVEKLMGMRMPIDGPVSDLTREVENIYVKKTSKVDPRFVKDEWAQKAFSKWRSAIAGVYAWRAMGAKEGGERERMGRAAEVAFRQAYLLCPYSPEAVYKYVNFLAYENRREDAMRIVDTSLKVVPGEQSFQGLKASLQELGK